MRFCTALDSVYALCVGEREGGRATYILCETGEIQQQGNTKHVQKNMFLLFGTMTHGKRMLGNFLEIVTNSSKAMTPSPSLSACFIIVSAFRSTSFSVVAM